MHMTNSTDLTATIVDLRLAGWSYPKINSELRINNSQTLYAEHCAQNPIADLTEQRYTQHERLERLHQAHYPHAIQADVEHTRTVLQIQKQQQQTLTPTGTAGEHAQTLLLAQAAQQALARLGMTPEFQADFGRQWQTEIERLQRIPGRMAADWDAELAHIDELDP